MQKQEGNTIYIDSWQGDRIKIDRRHYCYVGRTTTSFFIKGIHGDGICLPKTAYQYELIQPEIHKAPE